MTDQKEVSKFNVDLKQNDYSIYIGENFLSDVARHIANYCPPTRVCVVSDETVASLYIVNVTESLQKFGYTTVEPYVFPAGEKEKNLNRWQDLTNHLLVQGLNRKSIVVALGGGVVGDLAGFAASTMMRGIPVIQIPTTLLAQVDSSVGGKTGVNTEHGKNMVGTFYHPSAVMIDVSVLDTLPKRHLRAGYAEIMKYGLINKPEFFEWLEVHMDDILAGDTDVLKKAIKTSCQEKARIVRVDERETGNMRALLNLGHTFGHALESMAGYDDRILHGEAVGIGMLMAARFSETQGMCSADDVARIEAHLKKAGLPTTNPIECTAEDMVEVMYHDKKNDDGQINLILLRGIGKGFIDRTVTGETLINFLKTQEGIS